MEVNTLPRHVRPVGMAGVPDMITDDEADEVARRMTPRRKVVRLPGQAPRSRKERDAEYNRERIRVKR